MQISTPSKPSVRHHIRRAMSLGALVLAGAFASQARAQLPMPASTQFDMTGFLEEATLGGVGTGAGTGAFQGGSLKVNGLTVIVPSNTIVILPASAYTWQELFALAPPPYGPSQTGLALFDVPQPLTTWEVHIQGNRVLGGSGGADLYIAGLMDIHQASLSSGSGFINFMDYSTGEMRVGGLINDPTTGARVRLSDPVGRFGRVAIADARFAVDDANPTMSAGTGFPMCFPRVAPPAIDVECPQTNRPPAAVGFAPIVQMNDPVALPGVPPDATKQAPFEVGDYVTYAGTLVKDGPQPTAGPWPGIANTYVSAHTIGSNVAIYTWPGSNPAYVAIEVGLIGTGGLTVAGAGEAAIRTRFEGMTTDPSRIVHLYGVDMIPVTGATTDRDFGTIGVDPGPPLGAVKGRWRFRPPCTGTVVGDQKNCTPPPAGTFLPPPREVRAVIEGAWVPGQTTTSANGIIAGQYHAPIGEYIFPENIPGTPIVENNFNALDFLAKGGYSSSTGVVAGVLDPWPSNVLPTAACTPPIASPGGPYTVAFNGPVLLSGSATGTTPVSFSWSATAGAITPTNTASATFSALGLAAGSAPTVTLTASNACGTSATSTTVTVSAALSPTVDPVPNVTVFSGAPGSIAVTGSDPNVPPLALTFSVTQAGAPALNGLVVTSTGAASANITFTAPVLPAGAVTPTVITLTTRATNSAAAVSNPVTSTVTVQPLPDAIAINSAVYRLSQQRLAVTATSTNPNVTLTLQPYLTQTGVTFTPPIGTLTFIGANTFTITLVGAPEPACGHTGITPPACTTASLQVKSNIGGVSPFSVLTTVRQ